MAGALMGSGIASAAPIFAGTLSQWLGTGGTPNHPIGLVTDATADGGIADVAFTLNSFSGFGTGDWVDVAITEIYSGTPTAHTDLVYDVIFTPNITDINSIYFANGGFTGTNGFIDYNITSLNTELFNSVRLDVDAVAVINLEKVSNELRDANGIFLTLNSLGGQPDPLNPPGAHYNFAPRGSVDVLSNWDANGGIIHSASNQFDNTPVPEPTTIALMGLGLLGFAVSRKKKTSFSAMPA